MADATKIQLGACSVVLYHPTLGTVDLGHTIGGTKFTYGQEYYDSKVDKFGNSIVEKFLVGEKVMAEFSLAEFTLPNLRAVLNQGTLQGDDSVSLGSVAGKKASASAGMLVLHPLALAASVRDYDITIIKAVCANELVIEMKNDGEKVLPVVFEGLIDENRLDGSMLAFIGDSIS